MIMSSFSTLFSQGKNPYFIGSEGSSSNASVRFPDEATESYVAPANSLFFGKHFGKFRLYTSIFFPIKYDNERILTKTLDDVADDRIAVYELELSRLVLGSDFLFSKYNASWFVGAGLQNINAKVTGEFENLEVEDEEIKISGTTAFYRLGYTWTYIEWSVMNGVGKISEKGDFYEPFYENGNSKRETKTTGDYEVSQFSGIYLTIKLNF
jgi:hypothetical protein